MDLPFAIEYDISISAHWDVEEMVIKSRLDGNMIKIVHTDDAWYDHLDQHLAEFDNIEIVDISISPFTNTLPIKKLHLENGEPQKVDVIYFDENQFSLRKVPQIYSQIDNRIYRYQDVELPAFVSDIEVDDEGMVVELPKLFRRV